MAWLAADSCRRVATSYWLIRRCLRKQRGNSTPVPSCLVSAAGWDSPSTARNGQKLVPGVEIANAYLVWCAEKVKKSNLTRSYGIQFIFSTEMEKFSLSCTFLSGTSAARVDFKVELFALPFA